MLRKFLLLLSIAASVFLAACMSPPSGLNVALDRATVRDTYRVEVHPLAVPVAVNKMHAWEIRLRTASGEPVTGATFRVDGGMPQHGHGFPTRPRVTRELGDGRYLLEGMKFSMPGWWELKLTIAAAAGTDEVTFNTVIDTRAAPAALAHAADQR